LAAGRRRQTREHDRDLTLAWYTARLQRVDKMPSLQRLLQKAPQRQTLAEQRAILKVLRSQLGGRSR